MFAGSQKDGKSPPNSKSGKSGEAMTAVSSKSRKEDLEGVLQIANELELGESEFAGGVAATGDHRNIKFKKAKKLEKGGLVEKGNYYSKLKKETEKSRFVTWSKLELVELIIATGTELRNEANLDIVALRDYVDEFYKGQPMPARPPMMNLMQLVMANVMARRIQNLWIIYQLTKKFMHEEDVQQQQQQSAADNFEIGHDNMNEMHNFDLYMKQLSGDFDEEEDEEEESGGKTAEERDHELALKVEQDEIAAAAATAQGLPSPPPTPPKESLSKKKKKGANVLDIPWTAPQWSLAEKYADYNQPRKGGKGGKPFNLWDTTTGRHCMLGGLGEQFDLWSEGKISEFGIYGSGVTNYFKFIKWLGWLFFLLFCITLPEMVLNIYGPNNQNKGLQDLAQTTVGNLASNLNTTSDNLEIHVPGCYESDVYNVKCNLTKRDLSSFFSWLDILVGLVFFVAFVWLRIYEKGESKELDSTTVMASMYTIQVSHIPKDVTEEEIVEHFGKRVPKSTGAPQREIAGVYFAYHNADEIYECSARGQIIRDRIQLVHKLRYDRTKIQAKYGMDSADGASKIKKATEKMKKDMAYLDQQMHKKDEKLEKYAQRPAEVRYAFVTFENMSDKEDTLNQYRYVSMWDWLCRGRGYQGLKLRNKMLKCWQAPEPSTIIWENLGYSHAQRNRRGMVTTLLSLVLIFCSVCIIFGSKYAELRANSSNGSLTLCPEKFEKWTDATQKEYVNNNPDDLHCYCDQFNTLEQGAKSMCRDYLRKNTEAQVLTYFASFVVLCVNVVIEFLLKAFGNWEKHHTEDMKGKSLFGRLFVLKYINNAIIFLINSNNVVLRSFGLSGYESSAEFSAEWFNTVGTTVILVQLGDIVFSHGNRIFNYWKFNRRKKLARNDPSTVLTQDALNKVHLGPDVEFHANYATLLSVTFVCMTFSTGIPLLYLIAAANMLCYYYVEKYCFFNLYRTPPNFTSALGKSASSLLPFALIVHFAMSVWVLSNPELFDTSVDRNANSNTSSGYVTGQIHDKVTGRYTYPLFAFMVVLIAERVIIALAKEFMGGIDKVAVTCFGRLMNRRRRKDEQKVPITYSRAIARSRIKGLPTYNILQNPIYKDRFAITWAFAYDHKTVRAVRMGKVKAQVRGDEDDAAVVAANQGKSLITGRLNSVSDKKLANRSFYSSFYSAESSSRKSPKKALPKSPSQKAAAAEEARMRAREQARPASNTRRSRPQEYEMHHRGAGGSGGQAQYAAVQQDNQRAPGRSKYR